MKNLNKTLTIMLLIIGGIAFTDNCRAEIISSKSFGDGLIISLKGASNSTFIELPF